MIRTRRRIGLAVILALLLSACAPHFVERGAISEISDEEFWLTVNALSEPGGRFRSDNFVSNELTFQRLIPRLQTLVQPGGVYLGVGPEQNFSYMAALRPRFAIIVDIRRQNMIQHLMYKAIMELASTRRDFVSLLFSRHAAPQLNTESTVGQLMASMRIARPDTALYERNRAMIQRRLTVEHGFALSDEDLAALDYVYGAFFSAGPRIDYAYNAVERKAGGSVPLSRLLSVPDARGVNRSFLASEESYGIVRAMQLANLVIPVVGDFAGDHALRAIGDYLRDRGASVSAFYVSNVEMYLFRDSEKWPLFYENLASLPLDSSAVFIRPGGAGRNFAAARLVSRDAGSAMLSGGTAARTGSRRGSGRWSDGAFSSIDGTLRAYRQGRFRSYREIFRIAP